MKPKTASKDATAGPVRVEYKVTFSRRPPGKRRAGVREPRRELEAEPATMGPKPVATKSIPKATKMLVLGYYFERLVQEGKVKNYAEIARMTGLSRARISQITSLTLQAPNEVENLLILARSDQNSTTPPASNPPESLMPSGPGAEPQ